jgi:hypothetical protein
MQKRDLASLEAMAQGHAGQVNEGHIGQIKDQVTPRCQELVARLTQFFHPGTSDLAFQP